MAGQIIKRGDNKYLIRVYLGEVGGHRKYYNKTFNGNSKEAQKLLNKLLRDRDMGELIEPSKEELKQYLERWLEKVVQPRVAASTLASYKNTIKYYIIPNIGERKLSQLDSKDIQELYGDMINSGKAAKTVRNVHSVLSSALKQAVKWGLIHINPAELVDLPKRNKKEMKALTPEQSIAFLEASSYSTYKALFSLLIASGMRPGEALGLKWSDIDMKKGRVHVQRALIQSEDGPVLGDTKTPGSRRSIPIPAGVIEDLQEHKSFQAAEKLSAENYNDQNLVFATNEGEPVNHKHIYYRHFKPLLKDAGLPDIRLYDLRHTCATLLLQAGENPKIVSERLGHASITLTLDTYSHVLPDMQDQATAKLESILFDNRRNKSKEV